MRNPTIDQARFLAAAGIVLFHSGAPGAAIGYAGLPFFLILIVLMAWPDKASDVPSFPDFAGRRATRLLVPWLVWCGVYGTIKLAEVLASGGALAAEFRPWMLLTGPSIHLWFLPFALVASLCIWPVMRWISGQAAPVRWTTAAIFAALTVVLTLSGLFGGLPSPLAQWMFAVPAVTLGLVLALAPGWAGWLFMAGFSLIAAGSGWAGCSIQILLAGWAVLLCLAFPSRSSKTSQQAAELSLTIYLLHPLVMAVLVRLGLPGASLSLAFATFAGALLLSIALHKIQRSVRYKWHPPTPKRSMALHRV